MGIWTIEAGKEPEFVDSSTEYAKWVNDHQKGSMGVELARDVDNPNRFVTFGPWASLDDVSNWRNTPEFKDFFRKAGELSDDMEPITLEIIASIDSQMIQSGAKQRI